MKKLIQAKQGDVVEYKNLTLENYYLGVVVSRNDSDNGYIVVRLNQENKPFIILNGGVDFDTAFDSNIYKLYKDAKNEDGTKLW